MTGSPAGALFFEPGNSRYLRALPFPAPRSGTKFPVPACFPFSCRLGFRSSHFFLQHYQPQRPNETVRTSFSFFSVSACPLSHPNIHNLLRQHATPDTARGRPLSNRDSCRVMIRSVKNSSTTPAYSRRVNGISIITFLLIFFMPASPKYPAAFPSAVPSGLPFIISLAVAAQMPRCCNTSCNPGFLRCPLRLPKSRSICSSASSVCQSLANQ